MVRSRHAKEAATSRVVEAAKPQVLARLAPHGVTRLICFIAYWGYPVIWLVTETDQARSRVADAGCFASEIKSALAGAGLSADLTAQTKVTVESQETVDRQWDGNWWQAMK